VLAVLSSGCALSEDWEGLRAGTSSAYQELVMSRSPAAFLPLHDAPGTRQPQNLVAQTQPATVMGGVTFTGAAASFDGSGYIDLGAGYDFTGMSQFMIEAWVEPAPSGGSQPVVLFSDAMPNVAGLEGYQVVLVSGNQGQFQRGAGTSSCAATFPYQPGASLYLVVAYTATLAANEFNSSVFVNGEVVSPTGNCMTGLNDPALAQTGTLRIGADQSGSNDFSGLISEVAVYSGALEPGDIRNHYVVGNKGP
jgi:hypothetical protein